MADLSSSRGIGAARRAIQTRALDREELFIYIPSHVWRSTSTVNLAGFTPSIEGGGEGLRWSNRCIPGVAVGPARLRTLPAVSSERRQPCPTLASTATAAVESGEMRLARRSYGPRGGRRRARGRGPKRGWCSRDFLVSSELAPHRVGHVHRPRVSCVSAAGRTQRAGVPTGGSCS